MTKLLTCLFVITFASTLFVRAVDPVIPLIAGELAVDPKLAALLSTAFSLPYALIQPILGAGADVFGKTRMMTACIVLMVLSAIAGGLAPNFTVLFLIRALQGAASGGIFPIALATVGDLVPVARRQVTIGRLLAAAMLGNLLGAAASGMVGDLVGWRGVFAMMTGLGLISVAAALIGFRGHVLQAQGRIELSAVGASYRAIFRHPLAKFCFGAVFVEGIFLFGVFPYMALLLRQQGEASASIAGLVLGGFGLGGVVYALTLPVALPLFGERKLMACGGAVMGLALVMIALATHWTVDFAALIAIGLGFYLLHGVIQVYASELAPSARASAMALHSFFFFLGIAAGPLCYGFGFAHIGEAPSLFIGCAMLIVTGIVCATYLRRAEPGP